MIPEFAVLGHPNEGKSSVVSTLTEDDQIRVSRIPGETLVSRSYTVAIDGEKLIRFVDTPGFQVPQQTLAWFKKYDGDPGQIIECFIDTFQNDSFYFDECELLAPLSKGAGIIYVVDGSRPVRQDDLAEMEILRLTGRPRMAVINSKTNTKDYTADWKQEFRKQFNSIRVFNSNTANFMDRILMLESLKSIDQEWEPMLARVIQAFKADWQKRNQMACNIIIKAMEASLSFSISKKVKQGADPEQIQQELTHKYQEHIKKIETLMFKKIRLLFKHNVFEYQLPDYSILLHDLFSKQTWELLGLTKEQLATAGAIIGGTFGAVIDTAAAGITFGIFTAIGSVIGAGSAVLSGKKMLGRKKAGFLRLGGDITRLGPSKNLQFLYVLLDRALIYYSHIINRPHGKRDASVINQAGPDGKKGLTAGFTSAQRSVCARYFKATTGRALFKGFKQEKSLHPFEALIESILANISGT
ncbi:MAG: GTPase/DUF3482 domain-containing protein [Desulfobacula sp.]|nr:GTPase/DUF3482 domain-containing protein [Desulfobacula sp.]